MLRHYQPDRRELAKLLAFVSRTVDPQTLRESDVIRGAYQLVGYVDGYTPESALPLDADVAVLDQTPAAGP